MEEAVCRIVSGNWLPVSFNPGFILNNVQSHHPATICLEVNPDLVVTRR
jgi:hypothetical protein